MFVVFQKQQIRNTHTPKLNCNQDYLIMPNKGIIFSLRTSYSCRHYFAYSINHPHYDDKIYIYIFTNIDSIPFHPIRFASIVERQMQNNRQRSTCLSRGQCLPSIQHSICRVRYLYTMFACLAVCLVWYGVLVLYSETLNKSTSHVDWMLDSLSVDFCSLPSIFTVGIYYIHIHIYEEQDIAQERNGWQ